MTGEEAKEFLINISYKLSNMSVEYLTEKDGEKMREAIEVLEQEPFINKPCISSGACEHDKNEVLDKIRTEIKALTDGAEPEHIWSVDALAIIDKYKAESEENKMTKEQLEYATKINHDINMLEEQFGIDKFIAENIAEKLGELQRQFES